MKIIYLLKSLFVKKKKAQEDEEIKIRSLIYLDFLWPNFNESESSVYHQLCAEPGLASNARAYVAEKLKSNASLDTIELLYYREYFDYPEFSEVPLKFRYMMESTLC